MVVSRVAIFMFYYFIIGEAGAADSKDQKVEPNSGPRRWIRKSEAVAIALAALTLAVSSIELNFFELFARFSREHEAWQVDELFILLLFGGMAALALLVL